MRRGNGQCLPAVFALSLVAALCALSVGWPAPAGAQTEFQVPSRFEAISFLGDTLTTPNMKERTYRGHEMKWMKAERRWQKNPEDLEALIWAGRRAAYLGRYRQAVDIYTQGIEAHPDSPHLYRHRGHRYITLRRLDKAIADLEKARELMDGMPIEVEQDGLPNKENKPLTSLQGNVWYHLGLAYYLKGDLAKAEGAYRAALAVAANDDTVVSASYWLYLTLARMGREIEGQAVLRDIHEEMTLLETESYHELLMLFKGERDLDAFHLKLTTDDVPGATLAYGLSCAYELAGREAEARAQRREILDMEQWAAFGYLAAEADIAYRAP